MATTVESGLQENAEGAMRVHRHNNYADHPQCFRPKPRLTRRQEELHDAAIWCIVILCAVFVAWLLSSCGGSPAAAPQNRAAAQFSDARLQALWVGAQQDIITNGAV